MTEEKGILGFAGLGNMGAPMAANLLAAGYRLRVYNRSRAKALSLADKGAVVVESPAEAAVPGGILITMLSNDAAVEEVATGAGGFLGKLGRGGIHLSMSTISPVTSQRLADRHEAHGEQYAAAPVFGRPQAAETAQLAIALSGPASARERLMPVLQGLSRGVFEFGDDPGAANVVKLGGNFLLASAIEAMAEVFTLGEKNGLDRERLAELYGSVLFASPVYQSYGKMVAREQDRPAGFRLPLGYKDVSLVIAIARASETPMPMASLLADRFLAAIAKGRTDVDWSGIAREVSETAGLKPDRLG